MMKRYIVQQRPLDVLLFILMAGYFIVGEIIKKICSD